MNNEEILNKFKDLIVKSHLNDDPSLGEERLKQIAAETEEKVKIDTPLSSLGLDSIKMVWIIVKFEEEYDIDASSLSVFELYSVSDLLDEIKNLLDEK